MAPGGPAARAGFRGGDVIVEFGHDKIAGTEDFDAALRHYHSGQRIHVIAHRGAATIRLDVTLAPQGRVRG